MPSDRQAPASFSGGRASLDIPLLRALALGGKRSVEIQLLIDGEAGGHADYQKLALVLTGLSVPEREARATLDLLRGHQQEMTAKLGRPVKIKTAALDLLEACDTAPGSASDDSDLTYDQLVQMAFHDHLTGLANFRFFTRRMRQEVQRSMRYRHLLSMIMIDIDHFKNFNDRFGHAAGNHVLAHVAAIMREEARETDLAARYGGEEFALVLTETAKHEARGLAERLRARIEASALNLTDHGTQHVTVSAGIATFPRDAQQLQALCDAADSALYEAKEQGRNRVCQFQPSEKLEFVYKSEHAGAAQQVAVVGDFNGWSREADRLERAPDGSFRAVLHLAPGRYVYKFVINNEFYITDPMATEFVHDGYGGRNSMRTIKAG